MPRSGAVSVLFQDPGESPRAFSQRVVARHREQAERGTRIERVYLAVGDERSDELLAARARIARHFIAARDTSGVRSLEFLVPPHHGARHELSALAGVLEESLGRSDFCLEVKLITRGSERVHRKAA